MKAFLVTGATGTVGSRVVQRLLAAGFRPRVFVRKADQARALWGDRVDIAQGDLTDGPSIAAACVSIDTLFLVNGGPDLASRDALAAQAAKAAGVRHIVKLSSLDTRASGGGGSIGAWHAAGEAAVIASGVPYTFVQAVGFMSNALGWEASIRAQGTVRAPTGDGKIAMIHPDDIADVVLQTLTTQDYVGQILRITGPELLNYSDMVAIIGRAIGKPLTFQTIGDAAAHERMLSTGMEAPMVDALIALWRAVREGRVATLTDTVERVTGHKALSFERWAGENAAAFR